MTDQQPQTVAMIGLGNMGGRVAQRIHRQGLSITGYDTDPTAGQRWTLPTSTSIADATARADIILLSLPNSSVIEKVINEEGGVADTATRGQVVVDLSTASPSSTQTIHARLAQLGVAYIDAGLTGGVDSAVTGTMTLMLGGDASAIAQATPVLEAFSTAQHHMGPTGSGHLAKVLTNFLNGVALAATSEAMVVAKMAGLDLTALLAVFNSGSAVNWATRERFPHIINGDYLEGGLTVDLMLKDLGLYIDVTRQIKAPTLVAAPCFSMFQLASAMGYGSVISNHVVDAIGDLAGGVRLFTSQPGSASAPTGTGS